MKRFQNILVAVDSSRDQNPALDWAIQLAKFNQAKLKIVDVLPDLPWIAKFVLADTDNIQETLADQKRKKLESIAEPLRDQGVEATTKLLFGKTSFSIVDEVLRSEHDLVVRVTKGAHSERSSFFGTTSMRLLRHCPCAVWLVRTDRPPRFSRVLAAVDPAPDDLAQEITNKMIMALGQSIAEYEEGQLHVVHVRRLFEATMADAAWSALGDVEETVHKEKLGVASALDTFLSPYKLSHRSDNVHVIYDDLGPGHAISELASHEQFDLVVMGTIARTGLRGALLGNTAEKILAEIECSVLAIKPDSFTSPATFQDEE